MFAALGHGSLRPTLVVLASSNFLEDKSMTLTARELKLNVPWMVDGDAGVGCLLRPCSAGAESEKEETNKHKKSTRPWVQRARG